MAKKRKARTVRTPKAGPRWRIPFLQDVKKHGEIVAAAKLALVGRTTVYAHRDKDPAFASAIEEAKDCYRARILEEMQRRAIEGTTKGIYYEGAKVAEEKEFSDQLLLALAKAAMPKEFGTKVEHSGSLAAAPDEIVLVHTAPPDLPPLLQAPQPKAK